VQVKTIQANVIKIGGELASSVDGVRDLAADLKGDGSWVLVHGGGAEVSQLARKFGVEPRFRDGVRQTTVEEMAFVDMALSGQINKRLVRLFHSTGLNAVGLSGSDGRLFTGRGIAPESRTGEIDAVDATLLRMLLDGGYFPVLCSTSMDGEGGGLNINADSAALAVAGALRARTLVFLSDIPGVLKEGRVMGRLAAGAAVAEIAAGTITGGMVAKVRACLGALAGGVESIIIGEYSGRGSVAALLAGELGTRIVKD
jgi:acetylglutamate kinase